MFHILTRLALFCDDSVVHSSISFSRRCISSKFEGGYNCINSFFHISSGVEPPQIWWIVTWHFVVLAKQIEAQEGCTPAPQPWAANVDPFAQLVYPIRSLFKFYLAESKHQCFKLWLNSHLAPVFRARQGPNESRDARVFENHRAGAQRQWQKVLSLRIVRA